MVPWDHLRLGLSSAWHQEPPRVPRDACPHLPCCSALQLANASGLFSLFSNVFSSHPASPEGQQEESWG